MLTLFLVQPPSYSKHLLKHQQKLKIGLPTFSLSRMTTTCLTWTTPGTTSESP